MLLWTATIAFALPFVDSAQSAAVIKTPYNLRILHSFCGRADCRTGNNPQSPLVIDSAGNLYGTTLDAGPKSHGVVYEISAVSGQYSVIYGFCEHEIDCSTGDAPVGTLVMDGQGNLYGTAAYGGKSNQGTVFKLSPSGRTRWKIAVLYDFCRRGGNCTNGAEPVSGLTYYGAAWGRRYDGRSPLFGTTFHGGAAGWGIVFELMPPEQGKRWTEQVLYSFCSQENCIDGVDPSDTPVLDRRGNIYGSTDEGGQHANGTVYELSPGNTGRSWTEAVLHSFDYGAGSFGSMVLDSAGNLFGLAGGEPYYDGTLFELSPSGGNWAFQTLYTFCDNQSCDYAGPGWDIVKDPAGGFYGTSAGLAGETYGGTVFRLAPHRSKWKLAVFYSFCSKPLCTDGKAPMTISSDDSGNLFGVTQAGGRKKEGNGGGDVFELKKR